MGKYRLKEFKRKRWLDKRNRKLLIRRTIRKRKRKLRRAGIINSSSYDWALQERLNAIKQPYHKRIKKFIVPRFFSIEIDRNSTLSFFNGIFDFLRENADAFDKDDMFIDSSMVELVSDTALMYLFAIISDARSAKFIIGGNHPKNKNALKLYKQYGFDKVIDYHIFTKPYVDKDLDLIIARGDSVSAKTVAMICSFVNEKLSIPISDLYASLIEMMGNTKEHAYAVDEKLDKKWQLVVKNTISGINLFFLDTGRGIPGTVKKTKSEIIRKLIPIGYNLKDSHLLKSAFDGKFRTRTNLPYRGNGLPQIYKLISNNNIKIARVFTGKTECIISETKPGFHDYNSEFYGTLYEMQLRGGISNE